MKRFILILSSIIIINGAFPFLISTSSLAATTASLEPVFDRGVRDSMRHSIRVVLKDQRFQYHDYLGWLKWLFQKYQQYFTHPPYPIKPVKFGKLFYTVLKWIGVTIFITIPFILIYFIRRFFEPNVTLKERTHLLNSSHPLSLADYQKSALQAAQQFNYRLSVRFLYLAGLERLNEVNILPQSVPYSDKENIKSLRKTLGVDHPGYLGFVKLVVLFQEKWYGLKLCSEGDFTLAKGYLESIISNTGKHYES